jgi:electron transfer flavoprotein alpha subunit
MLSLTRQLLSKRGDAVLGRSMRWASSKYSQTSALSTLAILEQRDGQLVQGSLSALTAGTKVGGPVHAFLAGSNVSAAAEQAAKVNGVEKIITVENDAYNKVWATHIYIS